MQVVFSIGFQAGAAGGLAVRAIPAERGLERMSGQQPAMAVDDQELLRTSASQLDKGEYTG